MKRGYCFAAALLFVSMISSPAWAYMGPGAGLGMIGSLIAVIVAATVIVLGLVIYPMRKLSKKRRKKEDTRE